MEALCYSDIESITYEKVKTFVDENIYPYSNGWDKDEVIPASVIQKMADYGFMAASVSKEWGGVCNSALNLGQLCAEISRGSGSLLSLLAVHGMVCFAVEMFGNEIQKKKWLPTLASGVSLGAFALSEPQAGCDARSITTTAERVDNGFLLSGEKKWISFGMQADLILVVAVCEKKPVIFLVDSNSPGIKKTPILGMFGFKAASLAQIEFEQCFVPSENILGGYNFILEKIVGSVLSHGRFIIGHGALGIAKACLSESLKYIHIRKQFDKFLYEHQLIKKKISTMVSEIKAASLLCKNVSESIDNRSKSIIQDIAVMKYFLTSVCSRSANDAVLIHGANGFSNDFPVARFMRDAKILEIIEGSNEMHELLIADFASQIKI